jgi:SAM-dependent methyltransferase
MTEARTSFDGSIPETYQSHLVPFLFDPYAEDIAARVAAAAPRLVLETAAGTGVVTRKLREALPPDATITASDLAEPMLDSARRLLADLPGIEFRQADATDMPFESAAFDAVVCQFGAMFFPDKVTGYREAHRVLGPGGMFAFNVWDSLVNNPPMRIARDLLTDVFDGDPPGFLSIPFGYNDTPAIEAELAEAGFADIASTVVNVPREVPSARDLAHGLLYGNPSISEIRERGTADPEMIAERLAEALATECGDAPLHTSLQAIVFTARKT